MEGAGDNSIQEKHPYGEILLDRSKCFHGLGSDFLRMISILENGLLSKDTADHAGVGIARNHKGGYNLTDSISVAESPSINNTFTSECFDLYIRHGISFVIANENPYKPEEGSERDSKFKDEAFISGKVEKENIVGIMVPENLLEQPLGEIKPEFVASSESVAAPYSNIAERCWQAINRINLETGYNPDTTKLNDLLQQDQQLEKQGEEFVGIIKDSIGKDEEFEKAHSGFYENNSKRVSLVKEIEIEIGKIINDAFKQKLEKENPTLRDVLKTYIPSSIKTYNPEGFEINL